MEKDIHEILIHGTINHALKIVTKAKQGKKQKVTLRERHV